MPEWLYEEGIGENRAILVEDGEIRQARIERPGSLRVGSIVSAILRNILIPGRRGLALCADGTELLIEPLPRSLSEGARIHAEIVREEIVEPGHAKRAKARICDEAPKEGPGLLDHIRESGRKLRILTPHGPDSLEQAGWSELLEEAASGEIAFPGGALRMSLTPAMTLFDVDGTLDRGALAVAGAQAAAGAIARMDIGGSIGIDLPTAGSKEARQRAAAAIDAVLPQPFERTAVNGFGFVQIVRPRPRPSIPEILRVDPPGAAARALLRLAERSPGHGPRTLIAAPAVIAAIEAQPLWMDMLGRRLGAGIVLRADASLAISAGHVHSQFL